MITSRESSTTQQQWKQPSVPTYFAFRRTLPSTKFRTAGVRKIYCLRLSQTIPIGYTVKRILPTPYHAYSETIQINRDRAPSVGWSEREDRKEKRYDVGVQRWSNGRRHRHRERVSERGHSKTNGRTAWRMATACRTQWCPSSSHNILITNSLQRRTRRTLKPMTHGTETGRKMGFGKSCTDLRRRQWRAALLRQWAATSSANCPP